LLEDDPLARERLQMLLNRAGLDAELLGTLAEAQASLSARAPALMLLGREVAGEDGIDFVRALRASDPLHTVPILMHGDDAGSITVARALEAGCDDYLVTPLASAAILAKLAAHLHIRALRRVAQQQQVQLSEFRDRVQDETELARFLLSRLSRIESLEDRRIAYQWIPAEAFSGDLLAVSHAGSGELYGMLADATGHGLGAAINLIPLTIAFHAMAAKGFAVSTIAQELNRVVKNYSPADRFVAVTLARCVPLTGLIEVVNAGNPAALLVDSRRRVVREFPSGSIPLGILADAGFQPQMEVVVLQGDEQLLMFSDGLIEACNAAGQAFGRQALGEALARADAAPADLADAIRASLDAHCAGVPPADDVSLLVLATADAPAGALNGTRAVASAGLGSAEADEGAVAGAGALAAQAEDVLAGAAAHGLTPPLKQSAVEVGFSSAELQGVDVVPVMVDMSQKIGLPGSAVVKLLVVLGELFSNALEHGLLGLDSAIRTAPGGDERYFALRSERLAQLDDGEIAVRIEYQHGGQASGRLSVRVRDSGQGFDHRTLLARLRAGQLQAPPGAGGPAARALLAPPRGLALVLAQCDQLSFEGCGNTVLAVLAIADR
jgi:serine phosphatase RsbU (regulator of sigma subunit)/anti-sigma regulatory factor (Ser/Thr protein kinase)